MRALVQVLLVAAALACTACSRRVVTPEETRPSEEGPKAPVVIEIPHREGPPAVVLAATPKGAPLFHHELARLERWAARHLALQAEHVVAPVPPDELQSLRKRLELNRLHDAGPRCLAQPPLESTVRHAYPTAHQARVIADCSEAPSAPCRLRLELDAPDGTPVATWTAKVEGTGTFADWERAAQSLKPSKRPSEARSDGSSPRSTEEVAAELLRPDQSEAQRLARANAEPVSVTRITQTGPWSSKATNEKQEAKLIAQLVTPRLPALRECHTRGQQPTGPTLLVLDFSASGTLRTCDGYSWRDPPLADPLRCFCDAMSAKAGGGTKENSPPEPMSIGAGGEGRRLAVELREREDLGFPVSAQERVVARIENFRSSDPGIAEHWLHSALPWVAMCYAQTRLGDELALPARFVLDARGAVTEAQLEGVERSELLSACAPGYLRNVIFPCPLTARAELEFTVRITRERSGPSVEDEPAQEPVSRR